MIILISVFITILFLKCNLFNLSAVQFLIKLGIYLYIKNYNTSLLDVKNFAKQY